MNIKIGDKASIEKIFKTEDVILFSKLSGDNNPIHLNEEMAAESIFKKRIVHGFLYSSLISAVIAEQLPGPGSIYLSQDLSFRAPVFHGDLIRAEVEVIDVKPEKKLIFLSTKCYKNDCTIVIDGKAVIMNDNI
jgi:3-hydroxybutyryl-CoA dehydratase